MIAALSNENGQAKGATFPDRGSFNSQKDIKQNEGEGSDSLAVAQVHDLVPTGRGSFVRQSEVSLDTLLSRFDRAFPEHTIMSREAVIIAYGKAQASTQGSPNDRH